LIQTNNNRHLLELPRQLELRLIWHTSIGGGRLKGAATHNLDFSDIHSIKALNAAWRKFSRCKKSRVDVADYQKRLVKNINELHSSLMFDKYEHGSYQPFIVNDPKRRQIHKATVCDRLVHQAIVTAVEPLFEKRFIHDSYSCRIGKGTHAGVERLRLFLRKASRNNSRKVYVLKSDVRQFFASIDHEILTKLLESKLDNEPTLRLLKTIIDSHCTDTGKGIPLGNVTSQLFANVYLHELDWFMKQTLGVKYYLRYCDDFVVVSDDRVYLQSLIEPIREFLDSNLKLELHPNKVSVRSWDQGIDFLGYVSRPHAILLRTKTKRRTLTRVTEKNISSYLGICSHADEYRLSQLVVLIAWQKE